MQILPLGIQEFSEVRRRDCLYVDKTELIYELFSQSKYYFISRPRRFGKSLLINTLKEIALGNAQYFKGLWIESQIEWTAYPVLKFDFSLLDYRNKPLKSALQKMLLEMGEGHEIHLKSETHKDLFGELILALNKKYQKQVVILIDEYDKPIIDYLENPTQAEEHRDELKNLYSIIKGMDQYIRFFFLTGVSKFAKVGIFSDLNNILDITLHPRFVNLLGYTQAELEARFADRIAQISHERGKTEEVLLEEIKRRYNGYSWNAKDFVYNPYSTLAFMDSGRFDNYWFSTGTPTFLTKLLKKGFHYDFDHVVAGVNSLDTSNLANLAYIPLLFQTGYLTLKEELEFEMFRLDFPNLEVRDSFNQFLLAEYCSQQPSDMKPMVFGLYQSLQKDDFEEARSIFNALFASIPNDFFIENREKYYQTIIFLSMRLLGYFTQVEINSGRGRLDCVVFLGNKVLLFEFKLDKSVEEAIEQIRHRNYHAQYAGQGKEIYLIGANMLSASKELEEFLVEKI